MLQQQTIETIELSALIDRVRALRFSKHRLVQITATALPDQYELTYSFDLGGKLTSVRVMLPIPSTSDKPRLPSISSIYGASVLYENEIHDLFGIQVDGMAVDFHGNFYKTAVKYPMGSRKPPTATPVNGATTASAR